MGRVLDASMLWEEPRKATLRLMTLLFGSVITITWETYKGYMCADECKDCLARSRVKVHAMHEDILNIYRAGYHECEINMR